MLRLLLILLAITIISCSESSNEKGAISTLKAEMDPPPYAIVIHGGAGTILKSIMTEEKEKAYIKALNDALDIGQEILSDGGSSLDAVVNTIRFMEDSPLFNAGKGAVFTHEGKNELDASIMNGADQNAGAVGGIKNIKHPISAARAVMERSEHVLLVGKGAEDFAMEIGLEAVEPDYFKTESRWNTLQKILEKEKSTGQVDKESIDIKYGTVGCVALDNEGNIVAGTSTGGMTNKKYNRIGDSPIIGAGTYADNETCGVSCTGHGEFFIRYAVAYDVSARMAYKGISLETAANEIINEKLVEKGGSGGLIALDRFGNISMPFNSEGMYRGYAKPNERVVKIYKE